jgi:hypothetical protein
VRDVSRALRADLVCDTVEYLETQMNSGKRNGVENPPGLIIYSLEKDLPVAAGFISSRRRELMRQAAERDRAKEEARQTLESAYMRWVDGKRQEALASGGVFIEAWIGAEDKLPRMLRGIYVDDPLQLRHVMLFSNWQLDVTVPDGAFSTSKAANARHIPFASPTLPPGSLSQTTLRSQR